MGPPRVRKSRYIMPKCDGPGRLTVDHTLYGGYIVYFDICRHHALTSRTLMLDSRERGSSPDPRAPTENLIGMRRT